MDYASYSLAAPASQQLRDKSYDFTPWFTTASGAASTFEFANSIAEHEIKHGDSFVRLADKGKYFAGRNFAKVFGGAGVAITLGQAAYEYSQGDANSHTFVNVAVTAGTLLVGPQQ